MKKSIFGSFLAVALFCFLSSGWAYVVQPGDTLWELSGIKLDDPTKWRSVWDQNPFLKSSDRIFERDGKVVILLFPGEELVGLDALGIVPTPLPLSVLQPSAPAITNQTPAPTPIPQFQPTWLDFALRYWAFLWFAAILALIALAVYAWRFMHPETAGRPMVPNTMPPVQADLERRFAQIASEHSQPFERASTLAFGNEAERVSAIRHGRLRGLGRVQYQNGQPRLRFFWRRPGYQARYRFPGGREDDIQFLEFCGNDVQRGRRFFGFTFEPEREIVPAPAVTQPAPPPAEQPAVVAATAPPADPEPPAPPALAPLHPQQMTLTLDDLRVTLPQGSTVETVGGEIVLNLPRSGEVRVRRVRTRKARGSQPTAPPLKGAA